MQRPQRYVLWMLAAVLGAGQGYIFYYLLSPDNDSPILVADATEIDFGTLPAGLKVTREVSITNRGNTPLIIDKVQTGCGCSEAAFSHNIIAPAKSAFLRITLQGDGSLTKAVTIYVFSNDPHQPVFRLLAKSDSNMESFVQPSVVDFGRIDKRSQLPRTRSFRLVLKRPAGVTAVDATRLSVTTEEPFIRVDDSVPAEGNTKEIRVHLSDKAPTGDIFSALWLKDAKNSVSIKMDVCGYVRGEFFALPPMITLGPVDPLSETVFETVRLKRRDAVNGSHGVGTSRPDVESIEVSDALKGLVTVKETMGDTTERVLSVVITPKTYSGIWSSRQLSGHISVHCLGVDGHREVLNIPAVVALRLPRIRDK